MVDRPPLDCPTYANVTLAEAACQGIFLMWGESFNATAGTIQSSFLEDERAQYGPYFCETCFNGGGGYGYVGNDEVLPDLVDAMCHNEISCFTTCPKTMFETVEDTSCGGLQRYCEESGNGWLMYAKSFVNVIGEIRCSGGCFTPHGDKIAYGDQLITVPDHATDLRSWPIFVILAVIFIMFAAGTIIDYRLYDGSRTDGWFARYLFCMLGYMDMDGKRRPFWSQIVINPFPFLCDYSCCRCSCCFCCKDKEGQQDDEDEEYASKMAKARISFLSLLILSLGVAILFGDGASFEQECFFTAVPPSEDKTDYDAALPHAFHDISFGQAGPIDIYDTRPASYEIFQKEWWLSEMVIVVYELAQQMLAYNLAVAGYLKFKTTLCLMVVNSTLVLLFCWLLNQEEIVWSLVWRAWILGFLLAVGLAPVFNILAYGLAHCIVAAELLPDPCRDGAPRRKSVYKLRQQQEQQQQLQRQAQQDSSSSASLQQKDPDDDVELFKVVIPRGMLPGHQLEVQIGSTSGSSLLVVIPDHEYWQSESITNAAGEMLVQTFFYVEAPEQQEPPPPTPSDQGSSRSVRSAEEEPTALSDEGSPSSSVDSAKEAEAPSEESASNTDATREPAAPAEGSSTSVDTTGEAPTPVEGSATNVDMAGENVAPVDKSSRNVDISTRGRPQKEEDDMERGEAQSQ